MEDAVAQGIAAVETARLVVEQELDDRTFATTATATLGDARRELVDAGTTVSETDVTSERTPRSAPRCSPRSATAWPP